MSVDVSLSQSVRAAAQEAIDEAEEQVLEQTADLVERDLVASNTVPVRTGRMRAGYRTRVQGDTVQVVNQVAYSEFHADEAREQVEATARTLNQRINLTE